MPKPITSPPDPAALALLRQARTLIESASMESARDPAVTQRKNGELVPTNATRLRAALGECAEVLTALVDLVEQEWASHTAALQAACEEGQQIAWVTRAQEQTKSWQESAMRMQARSEQAEQRVVEPCVLAGWKP